ncbi:LEA5 protein [Aphelenchoides avenae]|nr:LEA5 protein [Aphelenchus avenae]
MSSNQDKSLLDSAKETASNAYESAKDTACDLKNKIIGEKPKEQQAADTVKDNADKAADKIGEARNKIGDKLHEAGNKAER